jgi:hypothetical protein
MSLTVGKEAWIRCKVQPGPFSDEPLVTIDTIEGPVSGFIQAGELKKQGDGTAVRGIVRSMENDHVEVWIRGSFFTTNGIASVNRNLATAA